MGEITYTGQLKRGKRGKAVKRVQEWLSLHGLGVVIDGDYGPATEFAVSVFQEKSGLGATGRVTETTFGALVEPLRSTLSQSGSGGSLRRKILHYARRHLKQQPRETGEDLSMFEWLAFS